MSELKARLQRHTSEFLEKARSLRLGLQLATVVSPVVVGFSKALPQGEPGSAWSAVLVTLQIVFLILGALAGALVLVTDKSALAVMSDAQSAVEAAEIGKVDLATSQREILQLEAELTKASVLSLTIDSMRVAVDVALLPSAKAPIEGQIRDMLDLLAASKSTLFGMGDELWNFSVYLWREDLGLLECVACRRPTRSDEDAPHRSWRPGEGHVGQAFQMKRALICADSTDLNVRGFFDAPEDKRTSYDDAMRYRSLAAIPFALPGQDEPMGVVVATSDVAERFRPEESGDHEAVRPIRALGKTLATLLAVSTLRRDMERDNGEG
jgi:hypothetical protein